MVDGNSGDLPDLSKGQFEAVRTVFSDPRPQGIIFAHRITFLVPDIARKTAGILSLVRPRKTY